MSTNVFSTSNTTRSRFTPKAISSPSTEIDMSKGVKSVKPIQVGLSPYLGVLRHGDIHKSLRRWVRDVQQLHDRSPVVRDRHLLAVKEELVHTAGTERRSHRVHHRLHHSKPKPTLESSSCHPFQLLNNTMAHLQYTQTWPLPPSLTITPLKKYRLLTVGASCNAIAWSTSNLVEGVSYTTTPMPNIKRFHTLYASSGDSTTGA